MEALVVLACYFEQGEGADDVGVDEWPGVGQGVVVVAFRGEMDDDVASLHESVNECGVANVAVDKFEPVGVVARPVVTVEWEVGAVACIGEFVDNNHLVLGVFVEGESNEIGSNKSGATGDQQSLHGG